MASFRFIDIDGKRYLWRDIVRIRREQKQAFACADQLTLFKLKDDQRPMTDRTAADRYREPSLFSSLS